MRTTHHWRPVPAYSGIAGEEQRLLTMTAMVQIEIPREVLHAARMTSAEIQRELAVHLFAEGKISFGKARELGRMGFWEFQQLLASRRIPVHYDLADYEEDIATLARLDEL